MTPYARAPIRTLMQRDVCTVGMDDTVEQVEALFAERRLSWAPVRDPADGIVGVIGSADLVRYRAQKLDVAAMRAWQLCTYQPLSVSADTSVEAVARLMLERGIHHVVVTEGGAVVGVVSSLDLLRLFVGEPAGSED